MKIIICCSPIRHMKTSLKVLQKQNELSSTCPKTSSLTVNVRSRISVILLSFIHCKLWWNSSSRYSKSLRSVTLWTTQYRHPIKIHNLKLTLRCHLDSKKPLRLTVWAGPCRTVEWRKHPTDTGGSEPDPTYGHWNGTCEGPAKHLSIVIMFCFNIIHILSLNKL